MRVQHEKICPNGEFPVPFRNLRVASMEAMLRARRAPKSGKFRWLDVKGEYDRV